VLVRVSVVARVDEIAVAVRARRQRVEVDPGCLDGVDRRAMLAPVTSLALGRLARVALRVVAREVAPRPHATRSGRHLASGGVRTSGV
jgi:hypothetical protein